MTNQDRSDQLLTEASLIAEDMRRNLGLERWNLAARRAQEVVELASKGILNEVGLEQVRTHDAADRLIEALQERGMDADQEFLAWFSSMSKRLAELRAPAFYHEIAVPRAESEMAVEAATRILELPSKCSSGSGSTESPATLSASAISGSRRRPAPSG